MKYLKLYEDYKLLKESLATAKKRFLVTDKISKDDFNKLKEIDPSKTFKYLEKLIEFYLTGQSTIEELQSLISSFDLLVSKNLIKNKDIQKYDYTSLKNEVGKSNVELSKKEEKLAKEDAVHIIRDDSKFLIVVPDTEESSCKFGAGTKWCTAATKSENHFKDYRYRKDVTLYYIINKQLDITDVMYKTAVAVSSNSNIKAYNSIDDPISPDQVFSMGLNKSIFKTIEPENVDFFDRYGINKRSLIKNSDGTYDYRGNIDISNENLTEIPVQFREVTGSFDCSHNKLKSLKGCPSKVGFGFDCSYNHLESLNGGPQKVVFSFDCSHNLLKSLEESPKIVGGNFYCNLNALTSLKGCPSKVGFDFRCGSNNLTSLKYGPTSVGMNYHCSMNKLESLEGSPKKIYGYFACSENNLTSLNGCPVEVNDYFNCSYNTTKFTEEDVRKVCNVNGQIKI